jgi:hypothetical protein
MSDANDGIWVIRLKTDGRLVKSRKFNSDYENRIIKALDASYTRDSTNIKALAQEYSVSYHTLRRRFQGNQPSTKQRATHSRLSEAQDHAL